MATATIIIKLKDKNLTKEMVDEEVNLLQNEFAESERYEGFVSVKGIFKK